MSRSTYIHIRYRVLQSTGGRGLESKRLVIVQSVRGCFLDRVHNSSYPYMYMHSHTDQLQQPQHTGRSVVKQKFCIRGRKWHRVNFVIWTRRTSSQLAHQQPLWQRARHSNMPPTEATTMGLSRKALKRKSWGRREKELDVQEENVERRKVEGRERDCREKVEWSVPLLVWPLTAVQLDLPLQWQWLPAHSWLHCAWLGQLYQTYLLYSTPFSRWTMCWWHKHCACLCVFVCMYCTRE